MPAYRCRICGRAVRYHPRRFAYAHVTPAPDHAPIPVPVPAGELTGRRKA